MTIITQPSRTTEAGEMAPDYTAFAAAPHRWRSIAGVPAEIGKRIPGFALYGIDPHRLVEAVRAAGPEKGPATPGWPEKIAVIGEEFFATGEAAERGGDSRAAEGAFIEAAFWFFFARFPHILNPAGAAAYQRHNESYARASRHFLHPVEHVSVPFDGGTMPMLLRLPRGTTQPVPLVMVWGGIDVWKSDQEIHFLAEALLAHGLATLAFDIPGTGECPVPVTASGERIPLAALAFARADDRIDAKRIGAYGLSFGGHFATKLALLDPTLSGVVQVGGPIHYTFASHNLRRLPSGTRAALARIARLDPMGDPAKIEAALGALSLTAQRLLPARSHAPLLSINGERDELVPIRDLYYLSEQGMRQDVLIFAEDRHCASGNRDLHEPFAVEWLARRLRA